LINKTKPIVLIGAGGHASVLFDILNAQNRNVVAIVSPRDTQINKIFSAVKHLDDEEFLNSYSSEDIELVNGIGQQPHSDLRMTINEHYLARGYKFVNVLSELSMISKYSVIGEGVQILNGAVIQAGSRIGSHSIINTSAIVEHDSIVGEYCFMGPGSIICGSVKVKDKVFIGASSTVLQNIEIGHSSIVGAGSVLRENLLPQMICYPEKIKISSLNSKG
jgi:UDP-4-amino-4,6-dideoxy-N-acetyl-beta-L-idosamine acetyltransferase